MVLSEYVPQEIPAACSARKIRPHSSPSRHQREVQHPMKQTFPWYFENYINIRSKNVVSLDLGNIPHQPTFYNYFWIHVFKWIRNIKKALPLFQLGFSMQSSPSFSSEAPGQPQDFSGAEGPLVPKLLPQRPQGLRDVRFRCFRCRRSRRWVELRQNLKPPTSTVCLAKPPRPVKLQG